MFITIRLTKVKFCLSVCKRMAEIIYNFSLAFHFYHVYKILIVIVVIISNYFFIGQYLSSNKNSDKLINVHCTISE